MDAETLAKRVQAVPGLDPEASKTLLEQLAAQAISQLNERRVAALQALEGNATKDHLKPLLELALDDKSPASVRDYAFDRLADIRSPEAVPPMWGLVQDDKNERLRWRAGEMVLAIGGNKVLSEFFSKLPSGRDVTYLPEELEGYASRLSQMNPLPREAAKAQLKSSSWWNRVIAIKFLERRGTKDDTSLLQRLQKDDTEVKGKGWAKDETVGKVAKSALEALEKRLKQASASQAETAAAKKK